MKILDHTGRKIGTWTVVEIVKSLRRKTYLLRCDCGNEKTASSSHITRNIPCQACKTKIDHDSHIGEKNGKITCLGYDRKNNRPGFLIQCDCGKKYHVRGYYQFLLTSSCKSCRNGYHPGKRVGNSILLEPLQNRNWKRKCDCGTIFIAPMRLKDCGCFYKKKLLLEATAKIGKKYHFLTVKTILRNENGHNLLLIKCKCGKEFIRPNGHEFKSRSCGCELTVPVGEKANKATLKNCEVRSIRELNATGLYTQEQLAEMFKKSKGYISRIIRKKIWKHT